MYYIEYYPTLQHRIRNEHKVLETMTPEITLKELPNEAIIKRVYQDERK